jgi:hypothetical protein
LNLRWSAGPNVSLMKPMAASEISWWTGSSFGGKK